MQYHLCVLVVTTVDKALSEAREALKQIGEEMEAWQAQMLAQMPTIHTCACVLPLVETTRDVTV